ADRAGLTGEVRGAAQDVPERALGDLVGRTRVGDRDLRQRAGELTGLGDGRVDLAQRRGAGGHAEGEVARLDGRLDLDRHVDVRVVAHLVGGGSGREGDRADEHRT